MKKLDQYITPQAAAKIIGVHRRRIYAMMKAKTPSRRLQATFYEGRWWILKSDVEKFADRKRPPGNPWELREKTKTAK